MASPASLIVVAEAPSRPLHPQLSSGEGNPISGACRSIGGGEGVGAACLDEPASPMVTAGGLATAHASSAPVLWNNRRRSRRTVVGTL